MPFEPRLVSPDDGQADDEVELNLPADLAALADQLRTDADRLALRYPADWCGAVRGGDSQFLPLPTRAARGVQTAWWSAVAAAAVLVLAAAWGAWQLATSGNPDDRRSVNQAELVDFGSPRGPAVVVSQSLTADAKTVRPALPLERAEPLLMHVSGPELEGVLDLLEIQEKDDPLLSI